MSDTPKLLLVDDEPGLRAAVQAYLEDDEEFTVTAVPSAEEAWKVLETDTPDLIISDIMMPQTDGYQFLQQLRDDVRFKTLPVVFLTARGMTSDRIQGYQAGVDAYLPKPFEPEELMAIVRNLLQRRIATSEAGEGSSKLDEIVKELATIKGMLNQSPGIVPTPSPIKIELTPREQSVLDLVARGLMNKEIASQLETSVRNVEKYVSRLFGKTGTNSRTELVRYALEHGLTN
ncbi:MAG: response regulator [Spirulina sp.]